MISRDISVAGTVQFRVDEETMLLLMEIADKKKLPLGTMVPSVDSGAASFRDHLISNCSDSACDIRWAG
ncbi:hypothetical protein BH11CYA1_BH11CYA1_48340 [soil metagenome]